LIVVNARIAPASATATDRGIGARVSGVAIDRL
jgi:hypothetical protein